MKSMFSVLSAFQKSRTTRQNLFLLMRFVGGFVLLVMVYSGLFHVLMEREGHRYSWITGIYWTLTVMSTLGFGDITFHTDLGRVFSMVVLLTGVIFMLVLLPFTFIEFFYAPWMRAQNAARAPRELPAESRGHVLLTRYGPIARVLIPMLEKYGYPYAVLVPAAEEALRLHDEGVRVMVGEWDDPETYVRSRLVQAALLVTTQSDVVNTNVTFTARELAPRVPIIASAESEPARDVLDLAGVTHVLRLETMMGETLARRVIGTDAVAHEVGEIDGLVIAEANASGTPLVGKQLRQSELRQNTGVSVVGVWEQGRFVAATPDTLIKHNTAFILAGSREQIDRYNELMFIYHLSNAPVLVVGGGGVGWAAAEALAARGLDYLVIEKDPALVLGRDKILIGDASDTKVLERAGLSEAATLIITSRDDDSNVYLTILCRRLRPDMQIISRCTHERNVATLHRAGADLVLSYGSMGANAIFNLLRGRNTLLMGEGVNIFSAPIPDSVAGRTVADSAIRARTGCTIIAVEKAGRRDVNPPGDFELPRGGEMVLIGTLPAEEAFIEAFGRAS